MLSISRVCFVSIYIKNVLSGLCGSDTLPHILSSLHSILCLLAFNRACDAKYQNNCCPLCSIHGLTAVCCMAPLTCQLDYVDERSGLLMSAIESLRLVDCPSRQFQRWKWRSSSCMQLKLGRFLLIIFGTNVHPSNSYSAFFICSS